MKKFFRNLVLLSGYSKDKFPETFSLLTYFKIK